MEDLFCYKHIIGLIWSFILIIILILISKKIEKKIGISKFLKFSSIIIVILEIIKFIYLGKNFTYNDLPLQFCSLMIYAYPLVAFGNEKIKKFVLPFAFSCGLLASLLALFLPTNILGNPNIGWLSKNNFIPTLSFIYHAYMLYFSLYLVISNTYKPKYKDAFKSGILILVFALIAIIANNILGTDFMMLNKGIGNPLKFILDYNRILYYLVHLVLFLVLNTFITWITLLIKKKQVS